MPNQDQTIKELKDFNYRTSKALMDIQLLDEIKWWASRGLNITIQFYNNEVNIYVNRQDELETEVISNGGYELSKMNDAIRVILLDLEARFPNDKKK